LKSYASLAARPVDYASLAARRVPPAVRHSE